MGKIRNILIPIDFSEASLNALAYGIEIAKIHTSDICLLHAYRLIPPLGDNEEMQIGELKSKLNTEIESKLKALLDYHAQPEGVKAHFASQIGFPDDVVESFISKNKMDLIIMATTGVDNNTFVFGHTLSSVIKISSIPVLAIPPKVVYKKWSRIYSHTNNNGSFKSEAIALANNPDIIVSEVNLKNRALEKTLFDENEKLDLLAIDNIDYNRIEKSLNSNYKKTMLSDIPRPLLIHC